MNKIKDFFYDKNDIIVALVILVAAAFIIYTRIDNIMAYPQTLVDASTTQESTAVDPSAESSSAAAAAPTETTAAPTDATTAPATQPTTAAPTETTAAPTNAPT